MALKLAYLCSGAHAAPDDASGMAGGHSRSSKIFGGQSSIERPFHRFLEIVIWRTIAQNLAEILLQRGVEYEPSTL